MGYSVLGRNVNTRSLRLLSGSVLWFYIASHLLNHSLGLWSIEAAERGLRIAVGVWHSKVGTVLLYGAFFVHLFLALQALYRRPSLRMPLADLLRIALGLCFPLLLVGHVAATRIAFEWYELTPQYHGVIGGLMSAGAEGRQLALLAPGWVHGCMGLHAAVRRRLPGKLWNASILACFIVLPLTAAAGFLAMGTELAAGLNAPTTWRPIGEALSASNGQALAKLRDQILNTYFGLIALTLFARYFRTLRQRRR